MNKKTTVESATWRPTPEIVDNYFYPNSFNEYDGHLHQCEQINYVVCIPCPWINRYIAPVKCETCQYGKAGSYSEGWTRCSYKYENGFYDKSINIVEENIKIGDPRGRGGI